jgi:hypothetical protein
MARCEDECEGRSEGSAEVEIEVGWRAGGVVVCRVKKFEIARGFGRIWGSLPSLVHFKSTSTECAFSNLTSNSSYSPLDLEVNTPCTPLQLPGLSIRNPAVLLPIPQTKECRV